MKIPWAGKQRRYSVAVYLAGVAVECLLLACRIRKNPEFESRYDLRSLLRPEEVLSRYRPEERLTGLGPEERLTGHRRDHLPRTRRGFSPLIFQ